jgi:peptidyl-prolyl cis-trans isomerase D
VFQVASRTDTHVPQFDEIKQKVIDTLRKERASALAKEHAQKLLERLKAKEAIDTVASGEGLQVKETGPMLRAGAYINGLGSLPELKEAAFQRTPDQPVAPQVYPLQGDSVIAVLKERIPADESQFDKQKDPLRDRIRRQLEAAAVEQFVSQLKSKAEIEIGKAYAASS